MVIISFIAPDQVFLLLIPKAKAMMWIGSHSVYLMLSKLRIPVSQTELTLNKALAGVNFLYELVNSRNSEPNYCIIFRQLYNNSYTIKSLVKVKCTWVGLTCLIIQSIFQRTYWSQSMTFIDSIILLISFITVLLLIIKCFAFYASLCSSSPINRDILSLWR